MNVDAQARGRITLRVDIDKKHLDAQAGQVAAEIDRRGGLSDTTFLICECDDLLHALAKRVSWPGFVPVAGVPGAQLALNDGPASRITFLGLLLAEQDFNRAMAQKIQFRQGDGFP